MRFDPAARVLLILGIVAFGGFGLAFALFPTAMAALVEVTATTGSARADVAATYGGLELGVAAFLALCLRRDAVRLGLEAAALAFLGLGSLRLVYLVLEGGSGLSWLLFAAEALGVTLAVWGVRRTAAA